MDVSPDKQNIDTLFSKTTYYIDFYQREYKWNTEPVRRLLEDVFYKFNLEYKPELEANEENINVEYSWYYLNTYVTNQSGGKVYVVDGQQRLTTITLTLIKLYHMTVVYKSELDEWLKNKIVGVQGRKKSFWMNHEAHIGAMKALFQGEVLAKIDVSSGVTAKNMVENYKEISAWIDKEITDLHKLETFVFYFLHRLVLINLSVTQTDVPMVFEVINDRGVKLKPYEILKGKLLGQIDKKELNNLKLNDNWETQVRKINEWGEDEMDEFFRYFLKAKFANTRAEGTKFDGDYHRELFTEESNKHLKLKHNPQGVKHFLQNDFKYYSDLYYTISEYYDPLLEEQAYVYYNNLNDMDTQITLMLSGCNLKDIQEQEKIKVISRELDRFYSLLQLQKAYDSNDFNTSIYLISNEIRGKNVESYRDIFDKYLMKELSAKKGVEVSQPFQYAYFKNIGFYDLKSRFLKYFFARVEKFIAEGTKQNMKHSIYDLVVRRGHVNGFHVEHVLAYNQENYAHFSTPNGDGQVHFNEELFEQQRNRLGGLLLLKGRDNISSNNEVYEKKLKSYANTLYWNMTLREDTYKSKLDMRDFIAAHKLNLEPIAIFDQQAVETRHRLLFDIVKIIWK
ncbi:MAG: DUF262 domain-containing protein [Bacteroidota bacterium]